MEGETFEIFLDIISPEQTLFHQKVESVELPGSKGRFTVLKGHAPLISSLDKGEIRFLGDEGKQESLAISSGFVEVCDNHVTACVEL